MAIQSKKQIESMVLREGNQGEFIYNDIRCTWNRDKQLGFLTGYIHIPLNHFNTYITKKNGEKVFKYKRLQRKDILRQFPFITFYQAAPNKMNNHETVFGISMSSFPSILPYIYDKQRDMLQKNFNNLRYGSLCQLERIMKNTIDEIIEMHKPKELQTFICDNCHHKLKKTTQYQTTKCDKKLCINCMQLIKQHRYTKRPPKGKLVKRRYTKYWICHECGLLTERLFAHAFKEHNLTMLQYMEKFDISEKQIRKGYYKNARNFTETIKNQEKRQKK